MTAPVFPPKIQIDRNTAVVVPPRENIADIPVVPANVNTAVARKCIALHSRDKTGRTVDYLPTVRSDRFGIVETPMPHNTLPCARPHPQSTEQTQQQPAKKPHALHSIHLANHNKTRAPSCLSTPGPSKFMVMQTQLNTSCLPTHLSQERFLRRRPTAPAPSSKSVHGSGIVPNSEGK